jgi:prepilin-type N-terminal cleavage/methylation domain-containing protein
MRRGFTLIELTACLALSAIVAALAVVSLHAMARPAQMKAVCARIAAFDAATRRIAREVGKPLVIEVAQQDGASLFSPDSDDRAPLHLPDGYQVESLALDGATGDEGELRYASDGRSATYAITLQGPGGEKHWMLFSGLTGQVIQGDDPENCHEMLSALAGRTS